MTTIEVNREVSLLSTVNVEGACTFNGELVMPNNLTWPANAGTTNQVLCVSGTNTLGWCNVSGLSSDAEYTRVIVTSTPYTITSLASTIMVNRSSSTTLTLPPINNSGTKVYRIIDISGQLSSGTVITVNTQNSEMIVGAYSYSFSQPYNSITLVNDGNSKWALV